jgi:IS1 family transposase
MVMSDLPALAALPLSEKQPIGALLKTRSKMPCVAAQKGGSQGNRALCRGQSQLCDELDSQIPQGQHVRYCTDHWHWHNSITPKEQRTQSKAHTHIIKSVNNRLRCYLARLRRKIHCYSKSINNSRDSLLFIFRRNVCCMLKRMRGWAANDWRGLGHLGCAYFNIC